MNANYITPSVTIFSDDMSLDLESQGRLFDHLISGGVDGILVNGSIGEFFAMPLEQRKQLADFAIKKVDHRVRLFVGTMDMVYDNIVPFSNEVLAAGADAVMIISPYYFWFKDDQLFDYYDGLIGKINGPVYLYNFPDRTGYSLSPALVRRLADKYPNLRGIKDTISGVDHTRDLVKTVKSAHPYFEVYSGFDDNAAHNVLNGGDGIIGGLSNIIPELCSKWIAAMRADDAKGIADGQKMINRMFDIYSVAPVFIPTIKEAVRLRGVVSSSICTKPMPVISQQQDEQIRTILRREGIDV
ncbi:MAG: dihydrodipicolinate synthase family protein [Lachnospiraceae bacterium]|jgi:4-hydroxy-tetrahydrodipicolinate synthase|nr:dihydrodipicolinate synthase family protein [Lachnospiraceae bacterium]MCH4069983.1 dihydrodipicolinate synthase family protein [Lachnospiraceae bacterium]MCH4108664.1 dihydrodipicolinate synthase family protein [Lachnospiraceae bacterium]MCI1302815.1 dihydrodipicolinate synthase family protein [Lachnospiraceae bacterium]MCI1332048.1 dihydrodipicolinate synthase family protein [Lachnospiraceae bacterium]